MFDGIKHALFMRALNTFIKEEIKILPANFKTTLSGLVALIFTIADAAQKILHNQPVDWPVMMAAISAAVGLFHAADATK